MAKIPAHIMKRSQSQGTDIPEGVFQQTSRAANNLFAAIGEVPKVFKAELDRAQDIRNQADVSARLRDMRTMQAEFLQEIQNGTEEQRLDPSEWAPNWERKLQEFERTLQEKGIPPAVLRGVTEQFKDFSGKSSLSIIGAAMKENRRRAQGHFDLDYQDAIGEGRYDDADGLVDMAQSNGIIDGLAAKEYKHGTKKKKVRDDLDLRLLDDPQKYKEDLPNLPGLSEVQRKKEELKADQHIAKEERKEVEIIKMLMDTDAITTPEELEAELEVMGSITDERKELLRKSFDSTQEVPFEEESGFIDRVHDLHEAYVGGQIDFETYRKGYDEMSSEANAYGSRLGASRMKGVLRSRDPQIILDQEAKAEADQQEELQEMDEAVRKEARRQRAAKMSDVNSSVSQLVRTRIDGKVKATVARKNFITGVHDPEKAEFTSKQEAKGFILRKELERKAQKWAEEKETPPTEQEIDKYIDEIQAETVEQLAQPPIEQAAQNDSIEKANKWLGIDGMETNDFGVPGTMLPKIDSMNPTE